MAPSFALAHLKMAVDSVMDNAGNGRVPISVGTFRHVAEALTIIELGLRSTPEDVAALMAWSDGKRTTGTIRQGLQQSAWPKYQVRGIWGEPWADHMEGLSRLTQPYSHFGPELLQWHIELVGGPQEEGAIRHQLATFGSSSQEGLKAKRAVLFGCIATWTLASLLVEHHELPVVSRNEWTALRAELASEALLTSGDSWADQFVAHLWIRGAMRW